MVKNVQITRPSVPRVNLNELKDLFNIQFGPIDSVTFSDSLCTYKIDEGLKQKFPVKNQP